MHTHHEGVDNAMQTLSEHRQNKVPMMWLHRGMPYVKHGHGCSGFSTAQDRISLTSHHSYRKQAKIASQKPQAVHC